MSYWAYCDNTDYKNFKNKVKKLIPCRYVVFEEIYLDEDKQFEVEQHLKIFDSKTNKSKFIKEIIAVYFIRKKKKLVRGSKAKRSWIQYRKFLERYGN